MHLLILEPAGGVMITIDAGFHCFTQQRKVVFDLECSLRANAKISLMYSGVRLS